MLPSKILYKSFFLLSILFTIISYKIANAESANTFFNGDFSDIKPGEYINGIYLRKDGTVYYNGVKIIQLSRFDSIKVSPESKLNKYVTIISWDYDKGGIDFFILDTRRKTILLRTNNWSERHFLGGYAPWVSWSPHENFVLVSPGGEGIRELSLVDARTWQIKDITLKRFSKKYKNNIDEIQLVDIQNTYWESECKINTQIWITCNPYEDTNVCVWNYQYKDERFVNAIINPGDLDKIRYADSGLKEGLNLKSGCKDRLVCSSWDQRNYYRIKVGIEQSQPEGLFWMDKGVPPGEYVVGCTAVAFGQLINYYFKKYGKEGWLDVMLRDISVEPEFNNIKRIIPMRDGYSTKPHYDYSINDLNSESAIDIRKFLMFISLGLESKFFDITHGDTSVGPRGSYGSTEFPALIATGLEKKLEKRYRFKDTILVSKQLKSLNQEENYIIESINAGNPILLFMNGLNASNSNITVTHVALIDGYDESSGKVKINWGWGNRGNTNDLFYNTDGPINVVYVTEDCKKYNLVFNEFNIYKYTIPNKSVKP